MSQWQSSPEAVKEIQTSVESSAILLEEIEDIKQQRKDLAKEMFEEHGIDKKLFNEISKAVHQSNFGDKKADAEEFIEAYQIVVAD